MVEMGLTIVEGRLKDQPAKLTISQDHVEIDAAGRHWDIPKSGIIAVTADKDAETKNIYFLGVPGSTETEGSTPDRPAGDNVLLACHSIIGLPDALSDSFGLQKLPPHLSISPHHGNPNVHFVISIGSGMRQASGFFENAVRPLLEELISVPYEVHSTTSDQSVSELTRATFLPRANQGIEQTVVLLSGDGGPVDMINSLLSGSLAENAMPPNVGLIPMGTGNALAHSSQLTKDSTFGLRSLLQGSPQALPVFQVTFSPNASFVVDEGRGRLPVGSRKHTVEEATTIYGAVVCSWGLHASLVATSDTEAYRKYGLDRFKMAAAELLSPEDGSESHRYKGRVFLTHHNEAGKEIIQPIERREHMYILATMVSNLEQHFCISPASKPLDGQMRMVSFGILDSGEVMRVLGLGYQGGKHVKEEGVDYYAIDGMRIEFDEDEERWRQVCVDGTIIAVSQGGWVEVRREGREVMKLVVPSLSLMD